MLHLIKNKDNIATIIFDLKISSFSVDWFAALSDLENNKHNEKNHLNRKWNQ